MKHPRLMVAVLAALLLIGLAGVCACAAEICPLETDPSKIDLTVWKFFHGDPDLLETAVIMGSTLDCEAVPIPTEVPEEEQQELRTLAMYGVVTGRQSDERVTGGTWLYSFETPDGKHIMTVELYRGLLVGPDGMYAYTVPQSAVSE